MQDWKLHGEDQAVFDRTERLMVRVLLIGGALAAPLGYLIAWVLS